MVRKMNEGGLDFAALYPPTEEASDRLTWQPRPEARFGQQRVVGDRIALQELPCLGEEVIDLSRDHPWHESVSQSCKTHVTRSRPSRRLTAVRAVWVVSESGPWSCRGPSRPSPRKSPRPSGCAARCGPHRGGCCLARPRPCG